LERRGSQEKTRRVTFSIRTKTTTVLKKFAKKKHEGEANETQLGGRGTPFRHLLAKLNKGSGGR